MTGRARRHVIGVRLEHVHRHSARAWQEERDTKADGSLSGIGRTIRALTKYKGRNCKGIVSVFTVNGTHNDRLCVLVRQRTRTKFEPR